MSSRLTARAGLTEEEAKQRVEAVISDLTARKASIKCKEITAHLESLGYEVTSAKTDNHKIVSHLGLKSFTTGSYDCGHGRNNPVKKPYVLGVIRFIKDFKEELINFLKEKS